MKDDYKNKLASKIASRYQDLEERIMQDIVRRIVRAGEITSTADWQINRLRILGYSSEDIEKEIKKALNAFYPEMFELYDKVINWEYVRNKDIYEQINAEYIPFEENGQLRQITEAIIDQSFDDLENVTNSLGFYLDYGNGKKVLTPLSQVYTKYLDAACYDIVTGAFDYNSVLRRVVTQLTNSGLRQIDYSSGRANRVDVAARRAVMTAVSQITGKISEYNAQKLGTEYFEVEWHAGARPTHAVWQGRVWSKEQLYSVCGLGTVTGLLGANCSHTYHLFFPGLSERNWTDDWLEEQNRKENEPREFLGKEYTLYEAKQRQRQMETAMRAQREKVRLLEAGGADRDEIILHKAKYQGQLNEYSRFCRKMNLTEERERIYYDMRGRIAPRKYIDISAQRDIIKEKKVLESKTYSSAIKAEEKKIYKDNVETAVLFDSRGNVLFRESSGASNYVKFSKEQLSRMKGATLTHNHPSSSTFSPADVSIMTEQGLNVIRATGTSKTYQLKKLNGAEVNHDFSIDYEKAMSDNKKITDKDFRKYEKERKQGKISPLEYQDKINELNKKWNDLNSDWFKKNSKKYGYKYGVIERGK